MIITVEPKDRQKHRSYMSDMFRLRARVFRDELGWDVEVHDGNEFDKYDTEEKVYLLSLNEQGVLDGALRLMPTSGPTLLTEVFSELVPSDMGLRSPHIWEATRFCVCRTHSPLVKGIASAAWHLMIGAAELAVDSGIEAFVTVYDTRVKRLYRTLGIQVDELSSRQGETGTIYFGVVEASEDTAARIRERGEIFYDVFSHRSDSVAA